MAVPDTLRGFRTQFLYTLYRVVTDNHPEYVYVPEGIEDLDIIKDDVVIETIQVKNLISQLSYGNLQSSGKQTSFFMRGQEALAKNPNTILKLTSFGPISKQLTDNKKLAKALRADTKVLNINITSLLSSFVTENVNEDELYDTIFDRFKSEFPAFNGEWEIRHLLQWISELAEKQSTLSLEKLRNQLLSFREVETRQIVSQAQLGTRVKRLFNRDASVESTSLLKEEFLKGVSVRPSHIQAEVDIRRHKWIKQIDYAFTMHNIMIVHGVSGQGKSALCYRYIKDYESFAFEIKDCTASTLTDITATVVEISSSLNTHVLVYFDAEPGEKEWIKLVKEFAGNPHVHILISIREEDWQSSKHTVNEHASYNEMALTLSKEEAYQIFQIYCPQGDKKVFIDKWEELGEDSPLLEFIFSITHEETLKSKLASQYNNLSPNQRRIVASIIVPLYLGGIPTEKTILAIEGIDLLSVMAEISSLQGEYFVKEGPDFRDVHPVRTSILKEIICNGSPQWLINIGLSCLGQLPIKDCSRYIVHLFQEGMAIEDFFSRLDKFESMPAYLCYEVVKGLLWRGCQKYVIDNKNRIDELRDIIGGLWSWMLPINYTDIELDGSLRTIFKNSINIYDSAKGISDKMSRQEQVFLYIRQWFSGRSIRISRLRHDDYVCLGKLLYLLSFEGLYSHIDSSHLSVVPFETFDSEDYAYLLLGLKSSNTHTDEWGILEKSFRRTLRKKYSVYSLVFRDDEVDSKILIDIRNGFEDKSVGINESIGASRFINNRVVKVCELLRMAYPEKTKFSCSLEAGEIGDMMIDKVKSISKQNLPNELMRMPRRMVCQIYENSYRPENKRSYFERTILARNQYLACASSLNSILKKRIKGEKILPSTISRFQIQLDEVRAMPIIELPASIFDSTYVQDNEEQNVPNTKNKSVLNYSSVFNKYSTAISNFFNQFLSALLNNTSNRFPAKYNLLEAIKECRSLSSLTVALGNPYSTEREIEELLKQEEAVLNKLWMHWNFITNLPRTNSTLEKLEFEWKAHQKSLPLRFSKDLKLFFENLGFNASIELMDRTVSMTLKYDNIQMYPYIQKVLVLAIKSSLLEYEYLSAEHLMLTQQIDTIKFSESFVYEGHEYCLTGLTWSIEMHDALIMKDSDNPLLFFKGEKSHLMSNIKELYILEILQAVILSMSLTSSQIFSAKLNKNEYDCDGCGVIDELEKDYKELAVDFIAQVEDVKNTAEVIEDDMVIDEVYELCDKIGNLCIDGQWLNDPDQLTQIANDIDSMLLGFKTLVLSDYIQRNNNKSSNEKC